jgi:hypothetical protein
MISLMLAVVMVLTSFSTVSARRLEIIEHMPPQQCHADDYSPEFLAAREILGDFDDNSTRVFLLERLGGFYGFNYEIAARLLISPAMSQFDEFFGAGAAHATLGGPNFRDLTILLGADLFHEIIEIENMVNWLECILGTPALDDLKSLYIWHPYAILRFNHFYNYYLPQILDDVRVELVAQGIIEVLDMNLSHEETIPRGFKIINGQIYDLCGRRMFTLDENGRTPRGSWISADFRIQ